jgi:PTS system ascorbate-specific IIA component
MVMGVFTKQHVQLADGASLSWQEAIQLSAAPLLAEGMIQQAYIDTVLQVCREKGPYMNIGPEIVLAHARPMPSNKAAVVSLLLTRQSIMMMEAQRPVRIWLFLATPDATSHIALIQKLAGLLMDPAKVKSLLAAASEDELLQRVNA